MAGWRRQTLPAKDPDLDKIFVPDEASEGIQEIQWKEKMMANHQTSTRYMETKEHARRAERGAKSSRTRTKRVEIERKHAEQVAARAVEKLKENDARGAAIQEMVEKIKAARKEEKRQRRE